MGTLFEEIDTPFPGSSIRLQAQPVGQCDIQRGLGHLIAYQYPRNGCKCHPMSRQRCSCPRLPIRRPHPLGLNHWPTAGYASIWLTVGGYIDLLERSHTAPQPADGWGRSATLFQVFYTSTDRQSTRCMPARPANESASGRGT
jgi:hypothetical protein